MSYSAKLKEHLLQENYPSKDELLALLSGFLRCSFDGEVFSSDQGSVLRFIYGKLRELGISCEIGSRKGSSSRFNRYFVKIHNKEDLYTLRVLDEEGLVRRVPGHYYQQMKRQRAYLKGAFLACGSLSDPAKSYHLELTIKEEEMARAILNLMEHFDLVGGITFRKVWVVYVKNSQSIIDFLILMGAPMQAFALEDMKILRSMKNDINRVINFETANINKIVDASAKYIEAIELIQNTIELHSLPPSLQEMAIKRWEEPQLSLEELGQTFDPPLSKSGVSNRLRRLMKIADKLREGS